METKEHYLCYIAWDEFTVQIISRVTTGAYSSDLQGKPRVWDTLISSYKKLLLNLAIWEMDFYIIRAIHFAYISGWFPWAWMGTAEIVVRRTWTPPALCSNSGSSTSQLCGCKQANTSLFPRLWHEHYTIHLRRILWAWTCLAQWLPHNWGPKMLVFFHSYHSSPAQWLRSWVTKTDTAKSQPLLCHFIVMCPWASYLILLHLCFLIYKLNT